LTLLRFVAATVILNFADEPAAKKKPLSQLEKDRAAHQEKLNKLKLAKFSLGRLQKRQEANAKTEQKMSLEKKRREDYERRLVGEIGALEIAVASAQGHVAKRPVGRPRKNPVVLNNGAEVDEAVVEEEEIDEVEEIAHM